MTHMPSVSAKLLPSRMSERTSAPGIEPASATLRGNVSRTIAAQPASWKRQNKGKCDQRERTLPPPLRRSPDTCLMLFPSTALWEASFPKISEGDKSDLAGTLRPLIGREDRQGCWVHA